MSIRPVHACVLACAHMHRKQRHTFRGKPAVAPSHGHGGQETSQPRGGSCRRGSRHSVAQGESSYFRVQPVPWFVPTTCRSSQPPPLSRPVFVMPSFTHNLVLGHPREEAELLLFLPVVRVALTPTCSVDTYSYVHLVFCVVRAI